MRLEKNSSTWIAVAAIGLTLNLSACLNSRDAELPTQAGDGADAAGSYEKEALALKRKAGIDYDNLVRKLQTKHGIVQPSVLPENPLDPRIAKALSSAPTPKAPEALAKTATVYSSGTYSVERVFMETVYLGDGDVFEWYTSGGTSGVDPVMVLYRYGNQSISFADSAYVDHSTQHFNTIYAYSDDDSYPHPKITYTVPSGEGGYFAVMVMAYSDGNHGTTTLYKKRLPSGGSWITSNQQITVTGKIVRYDGSNKVGYLTANRHSGTSADPWAFWWDFENMWGGANDDWGGTVNSWAALSGPHPASKDNHYLNCMVFTGYNSLGTADWIHSN